MLDMWRISWEKDKRGDMLSCFSHVQLFVILWTVVCQAPLFVGISRQENSCTSVFTEALFTTARTWKKPRCPSMDEEIKKLWYMCAIEYFPARKRKAYESVLMGWMDLQPIIRVK